MEASTKVYTIHFNHNATHKGFNQTLPGGLVGGQVGAQVGGQHGWRLGDIRAKLSSTEVGDSTGTKFW